MSDTTIADTSLEILQARVAAAQRHADAAHYDSETAAFLALTFANFAEFHSKRAAHYQQRAETTAKTASDTPGDQNTLKNHRDAARRTELLAQHTQRLAETYQSRADLAAISARGAQQHASATADLAAQAAVETDMNRYNALALECMREMQRAHLSADNAKRLTAPPTR